MPGSLVIPSIQKIRPLYLQILFVILAFVLMVVLSNYFMSKIVRRHMVREAKAALDFTQANITADLLEPESMLGSIAETVRTIILQINEAEIVEDYLSTMTKYILTNDRFLSKVTGVYGYFDVFGGKFYNAIGWTPPDDYTPADRPWYKVAVEADGEIGITDPYLVMSLGVIAITYARRIFDDEGRPLGVVCTDVLLDRIREYAENTYIVEGGYGILMDKDFRVIAHPSPMYIGRYLREMNDGPAIENELRKNTEVFERKVIDYRGNPSVAFIRQFNNGWYMGIITHAGSYFSEVQKVVLILSMLGVLMASALIAILIRIDMVKQRSDTMNRQKSNFLAKMSHEIRTPLNAILGIAEIQMQNKTLPPYTNEALGKIYNSGYLLLGIINDILDFSKIEAGKLELMPIRYDVASLIHDTVQLNMMRIGSKQIDFKLKVDPFIPAELYGDELRVKQIFNNLLSNAFKYTKSGEVILSITAQYEDRVKDPYAKLIIVVRDTGQGMSAEQVQKLFDEYTRFNMAANRLTQGTGLGMSITQSLIHLMNGKIMVESELGKGSVFTVHLPQKIVGSGPLGKGVAENLERFRFNDMPSMKTAQIVREPMPYGSVLIVDDVETNIYVAKGLMSPYGLSIDTASSGATAIEKIREGKVYDIVFMDHMMPNMDGIEATKIIRGLGYARPIVALTANAVLGQAEMFLSNGFDDFISKPIDIRQLNASLNKLIRDKQPPEVLAAARKGRVTEAAADAAQGDALHDNASFVDPELTAIFVRDAAKAMATLEKIYEKHDHFEDDDIQLYVINTHAMKSALANIGETSLSDVARRLEVSGRERNITVITDETPFFLDKLRILIERLKPGEEDKNDDGGEITGEDRAYLQERLLMFRAACTVYEKKAAKDVLLELKQKNWPRPVKEMLNALLEHLLHSEFDEAASMVRDYEDTL